MRFRLLLSVSVFALMTAPALAGFEFVSPTPAPAPVVEMPPVEDSVPAIASEPVQIAPMEAPAPIMSAPMADEPMQIGAKAIPLTPVVKHSDALLLDEAMPAPAPVTAPKAPAPAAIAWEATPSIPSPAIPPAMPKIDAAELEDDGMPIEGFGRGVPLVLALQQIAPPEYRYSFDYGVDAGMRINWTGGKSWKAVIVDIARDNGLSVDIVSNVIAFHRRSPMEIVDAQTAMDRTPDTVQGMKLKPLEAPPMPAALPMPTAAPVVGASAEAQPMSILQPLEAQAPETPSPAPQPVAVDAPARELLAEAKAAAAGEKPKIIFDPLLDADKPAKKVVKDKQILTADSASDDMTVLPPVVSPSVSSSDIVFDDAPALEKPAAAPQQVQLAADIDTVSEWQGVKNATLRDVLTEWSERAGVSVVWSSEFDYPLQTDVRIQASYTDAVRTLLAGFGKASPRPIGRLFKNKAVGAQPVLVVETQHLTR